MISTTQALQPLVDYYPQCNHALWLEPFSIKLNLQSHTVTEATHDIIKPPDKIFNKTFWSIVLFYKGPQVLWHHCFHFASGQQQDRTQRALQQARSCIPLCIVLQSDNWPIVTAIENASFNATSTSADNHDSSTTTLLTNHESITLNAVNFIAFRGETIVGNQSENDIVYYLSERSQSTWNGNNHVNVTGQRLSALNRTTKLTVTILEAWHYRNWCDKTSETKWKTEANMVCIISYGE